MSGKSLKLIGFLPDFSLSIEQTVYLKSSPSFGLVVTDLLSDGVRNEPTKFTGSAMFGQVICAFLGVRINFSYMDESALNSKEEHHIRKVPASPHQGQSRAEGVSRMTDKVAD